jgi:hypothetical protein
LGGGVKGDPPLHPANCRNELLDTAISEPLL